MRRAGFVGLVLCLLARLCAAMDASELYNDSLSVAARDDKSRAADLRLALTHVMERVIAPDDLGSKAVTALLDKASDFVDQYEYRSGPGAVDHSSQTTLAVRFDQERIDEALARAKIGVWGESRPEMVVWLAVADGPATRFVGGEDGGALTAALQKAAERRRISAILPLLDLTDQGSLNAADIESGNIARIRSAAWRYETEVALVGVLVPAGDFQWESRWRFVGPGQSSEWKLGPMGSEEVMRGAVDGAYGHLVRLYAPGGRGANTLEVQVEGILSMNDGDRCGQYLRTLPTVRRADWASADASVVSWRLSVAGNAESFRAILADSRRLRPVAGPGQSGGGRVYQWVP